MTNTGNNPFAEPDFSSLQTPGGSEATDEDYDDDEEGEFTPPTATAALKRSWLSSRPRARPATGTEEDGKKVSFIDKRERIVFHPPCTLQHAQNVRGVVEALLIAAGAQVLPFKDSHLCCGSAGTYSVLQPELATQLRDRKLDALMTAGPDTILSANVGCIAHLASAAPVSVQHWIEWVDSRLYF